LVVGSAYAQQTENWRKMTGAEVRTLVLSHRLGGINQFEQPYLIVLPSLLLANQK